MVEAGHNAQIRRQLAETGSRVNAWFATWLRLIGSRDTDRDVHVLGNYLTGLMLHQLAIPIRGSTRLPYRGVLGHSPEVVSLDPGEILQVCGC